MKTALAGCTGILLALLGTAQAQEEAWLHSGSFTVLTTPEGADLPASASEEGFPLLVRLHKDFFDFSQAKPKGEDLRFFAEGKPLTYQIEEWDAAKGTAGIWVRVPLIKGNERQEIQMRWGKANGCDQGNRYDQQASNDHGSPRLKWSRRFNAPHHM